ncbi:uncharacterized protein FFC1_15622 [Fusarium fujikuroi]|nr:uncharacterized protein FFC1_15622 [Fusarium fujikuroi]
MASQYGWLNSL